MAEFDLLKKDDLTREETKRIKTVAVKLYVKLGIELARIRGWERREATRDSVKLTIFNFLYGVETGLPTSHSEEEITQESNLVFAQFLSRQQNGMALVAV